MAFSLASAASIESALIFISMDLARVLTAVLLINDMFAWFGYYAKIKKIGVGLWAVGDGKTKSPISHVATYHDLVLYYFFNAHLIIIVKLQEIDS